jgi:TPR repeat protein
VRQAERGNAKYQTYLGYMYQTGQNVPQDYHLAAHWYIAAAERGDIHGQHLLGLLYNLGLGVRQDFVEAYKWLNLAAAGAGGDDRDYYARMRDAVASKLSLLEIYDAQRRARDWTAARVR